MHASSGWDEAMVGTELSWRGMPQGGLCCEILASCQTQCIVFTTIRIRKEKRYWFVRDTLTLPALRRAQDGRRPSANLFYGTHRFQNPRTALAGLPGYATGLSLVRMVSRSACFLSSSE